MDDQTSRRAFRIPGALAARVRWRGMVTPALAAALLTIALAALAGYAVAGPSWRNRTTADQLTLEQRATVYEYASNRLCKISLNECVRLSHVIMQAEAEFRK